MHTRTHDTETAQKYWCVSAVTSCKQLPNNRALAQALSQNKKQKERKKKTKKERKKEEASIQTQPTALVNQNKKNNPSKQANKQTTTKTRPALLCTHKSSAYIYPYHMYPPKMLTHILCVHKAYKRYNHTAFYPLGPHPWPSSVKPQ